LLGKAAVVGGSAWVAPSLLTSVAHAQGSTPTTTEPPVEPGFSPISIGGFGNNYLVVDRVGHTRVTDDRGASWFDPMSGGTTPVIPVAVTCVNFLYFWFVWGSDGIYRSGNGGYSWEQAPPYPSGFVPIASSPSWGMYGVAGDGSVLRNLSPVTPVDIMPVAIAGTESLGPSDAIVVDSVGSVRIWPASGTTWSDPTGGTGVGLAPVAVLAAATGSRRYCVADAAGEVRTSTDGGVTWVDSQPVGLRPVAMAGHGNTAHPSEGTTSMAVDAAGNVRVSTDRWLSWSTPAGSPIT
jgi:hypothetical protein